MQGGKDKLIFNCSVGEFFWFSMNFVLSKLSIFLKRHFSIGSDCVNFKEICFYLQLNSFAIQTIPIYFLLRRFISGHQRVNFENINNILWVNPNITLGNISFCGMQIKYIHHGYNYLWVISHRIYVKKGHVIRQCLV